MFSGPHVKQNNTQSVSGKEIKKIQNQINNMFVDEEIYWKQRSRAEWLREGDKNTKFFYSKVSAKKRKNKIWGIENTQGQVIEE